jgi:hypothetical protein
MKAFRALVLSVLSMMALVNPRPAAANSVLCAPTGCTPCTAECGVVIVAGTILNELDRRANVAAKRKGSGQTPAKLVVKERALTITVDGEVMRNRGQGAWTRIRAPQIEVTERTASTVTLATAGEWLNSSRHAHWQGTFTLVLSDSKGRQVTMALVQDDQRTGRRFGPEYQKKNWTQDAVIPEDFWPWVQQGDVQATVRSFYRRRS